MENDFRDSPITYNQFIPDEEDIVIKPSTELTPDEYEHTDNNNIAVHMFCESNSKENMKNCKLFAKTLCNIGYDIDLDKLQNHVHNLDKTDHDTIISAVVEKANNEETDGLILFYSGTKLGSTKLKFTSTFDDKCCSVDVSGVWKNFTSGKCPGLKNKPKLFIFQAANERPTQTDSIGGSTNYDTPAEADILIIYNETDALSHHDITNFSKQICDNISNYGCSEDAVSLVTYTENEDKSRPLIISTMTRKFYFTPSPSRGDHHYISEENYKLTQELQLLKDKLKEIGNRNKSTASNANSQKSKDYRRITSSDSVGKSVKSQNGVSKNRSAGTRKISSSERPPWNSSTKLTKK